jgi:hypothetical protein
MKKYQLKQLIQEVLREVESEDSKNNHSSESDFTKNVSGVQKKSDEVEIKMTVRGVKPGGAYKKFLAKLATDAVAADWAVLKADMEKSGIKVASMNEDDLTDIAVHAGKPELSPKPAEEIETDITSVNPTTWKGMSPEKRDKYIKAGSHAEEWEKATAQDVEDTRKKTALKASKIKAGTYDPEDTSLWTDKEWDEWNTKGGGQDSGKSGDKYKPNLSKKTAQGIKGAVRGNFSDTLR